MLQYVRDESRQQQCFNKTISLQLACYLDLWIVGQHWFHSNVRIGIVR